MTDKAVEHFDAIVIGSGFGGSVMTERLSDAGKRVLLLERGQSFGPGDFPRSPRAFRKAFWDPSAGGYGMYNVWSFPHFGAVVSSGLGGGSLIYANVMIRKDADTFVDEPNVETWPVTRDELDPHYERAEQMLNAQTYPLDHPSFRTTQDANLHGRRQEAGLGSVPAQAGRHVCERGPRTGHRRGDRRGRAEPPWPPTRDLPPARRVRHRLQHRRQELARLQLSVRGEAPRRRYPDALRGTQLRTSMPTAGESTTCGTIWSARAAQHGPWLCPSNPRRPIG